jgi:hypothetical protein
MKAIMGDFQWRIFAEGEIQANSGAELEHFLIENQVPFASRLYLHSAGGSLEGAMTLGRVIRGHELHVSVGKKGAWRDEGFGRQNQVIA